MVNYYKLIDTITGKIEYWKGDTSSSSWLLHTSKMIVPLGNKLPKNVSRETLKYFKGEKRYD